MADRSCKLVEISSKLETDYLVLAKEGIEAGETPSFSWDMDFEELLVFMKGENLPDGIVQMDTYLLFCNERVIGRCSLRRELNDGLKIWGGHIGYGIRKSERRKGFGTLILELAIEKARALGIKRVFVTCSTSNVGSAKVIEKCGGILDRQLFFDAREEMISQYWITL